MFNIWELKDQLCITKSIEQEYFFHKISLWSKNHALPFHLQTSLLFFLGELLQVPTNIGTNINAQ